jgi:ABC-type branched-subunit amino acid transport system substrate-binding protein
MQRVLATLGALVLAGSLASCGDSDADGGSSGEAGGPITVYYIGSTDSPVYSFPETSDAAKARFEAVNAAGGVDGRKINFVSCNDKADPNEASACARRAAEDDAVAVIGGVSAAGDPLASALEQASIVYTGTRPLAPAELNSPIAFPLVGGGSSTAGGGGMNAVEEQGCKTPYVIEGDVPGNRAVAAAFKKGVATITGEEPKGTVTPATSNDYAPAASAAAAAGADCIYFAISVPEMPKAIPTFRKTVPDAKIITSNGKLPAPIIQALGADANGIILNDSQIPVTTPGNKYLEQFGTEMDKYTPDAAHSAFALSSWMGADFLITVLDSLKGDISASTVLDAYKSWGAVDGHGVIGNFSFGDAGPVASLPRLFNLNYTTFTVVDGVPTVDGGKATFGDASPALK